jgi:hypothetical protein
MRFWTIWPNLPLWPLNRSLVPVPPAYGLRMASVPTDAGRPKSRNVSPADLKLE